MNRSSWPPPLRSSFAFYNAIEAHLNDDAGVLATNYVEENAKDVPGIALKEYKNIGHLQLLNDRKGPKTHILFTICFYHFSPFKDVCYLLQLLQSFSSKFMALSIEIFSGNSNVCASNEEEEARLPEIRHQIAQSISEFF